MFAAKPTVLRFSRVASNSYIARRITVLGLFGPSVPIASISNASISNATVEDMRLALKHSAHLDKLRNLQAVFPFVYDADLSESYIDALEGLNWLYLRKPVQAIYRRSLYDALERLCSVSKSDVEVKTTFEVMKYHGIMTEASGQKPGQKQSITSQAQ